MTYQRMGKLKIKKQIKRQPLSSVSKHVESLELKIQNGTIIFKRRSKHVHLQFFPTYLSKCSKLICLQKHMNINVHSSFI